MILHYEYIEPILSVSRYSFRKEKLVLELHTRSKLGMNATTYVALVLFVTLCHTRNLLNQYF